MYNNFRTYSVFAVETVGYRLRQLDTSLHNYEVLDKSIKKRRCYDSSSNGGNGYPEHAMTLTL